MKKLRVLLLAKAYPPVVGGVETYSEEVCRAYLALGHDVTVVTQTKAVAGWTDRVYPEGKVALFNTGPGGQAKVLFSFVSVLSRLFRTRDFDIVHATTWRPAIALLPWFSKAHSVVTVHGREVLNYPFYLKRPMIRVLRKADTVVTVSAATMEIARAALFGQEPAGRWHVAFNGISFRDQACTTPQVKPANPFPVLLTVARQVPRKNIDQCIRALGVLRDEGLDFHYWIVGTGPMHDKLKTMVCDLKLGDCIKFLGYRPDADLPDLYLQSDVFLHPQTNQGEGNDFEGFGLVIADAMSFGCAILAGKAGGPRDFIQDGQNGLLVDGLNQTEITDGIRRLLTDSGLRSRMATAGRETALSDFSWARHVELILSTLQAGSDSPQKSAAP